MKTQIILILLLSIFLLSGLTTRADNAFGAMTVTIENSGTTAWPPSGCVNHYIVGTFIQHNCDGSVNGPQHGFTQDVTASLTGGQIPAGGGAEITIDANYFQLISFGCTGAGADEDINICGQDYNLGYVAYNPNASGQTADDFGIGVIYVNNCTTGIVPPCVTNQTVYASNPSSSTATAAVLGASGANYGGFSVPPLGSQSFTGEFPCSDLPLSVTLTEANGTTITNSNPTTTNSPSTTDTNLTSTIPNVNIDTNQYNPPNIDTTTTNSPNTVWTSGNAPSTADGTAIVQTIKDATKSVDATIDDAEKEAHNDSLQAHNDAIGIKNEVQGITNGLGGGTSSNVWVMNFPTNSTLALANDVSNFTSAFQSATNADLATENTQLGMSNLLSGIDHGITNGQLSGLTNYAEESTLDGISNLLASMVNTNTLDTSVIGTNFATSFANAAGQVDPDGHFDGMLSDAQGAFNGSGIDGGVEINALIEAGSVGGTPMTFQIAPERGIFRVLWTIVHQIITWILCITYAGKIMWDISEATGTFAKARGTLIQNLDVAGFNIAGLSLYVVMVIAVMAGYAAVLAIFFSSITGAISWTSMMTSIASNPLTGADGGAMHLLAMCLPISLIFGLAWAYLIFRITVTKVTTFVLVAIRVMPQ